MSLIKLLNYLPFVCSVTVKLEAKMSEACVLQALEDNFERRHLFANK